MNPSARDDALDRLAGVDASARLRSSSRFEGRPAWRASAAFDGNRRSGWTGEWTAGAPAWIEWRPEVTSGSPRRLRLTPMAGARFPSVVRLRALARRGRPRRQRPAGG